jgi:hypothetical protein
MIDLQKLEGKPQIGLATMPDGRQLQAEFFLQGRDTYIAVHEPSTRIGKFEGVEMLPVRMTDGTHLTFLGNVISRGTDYHGNGGRISEYQPHFVLAGRSPLDAAYRIKSLSFSVDDAESLFYDFDAFSIAIDCKEQAEDIIAAQAAKFNRPIEVGEDSILAYFTGKLDILSAETALGKLSVRHRPSYNTGGPGGVSIKNRIILQLDFPEAKQIDGAVRYLMPHLRFLQLMAGRKQKLSALNAQLDGVDEHNWSNLIWCLAWSRETDGKEPSPADLPINGGFEPEEFVRVLSEWIRTDKKRADSRIQFAESFGQYHKYKIDRLVSAANMFDILPSECFSKPENLSSDLAAARNGARKLFKALPMSDVRNRALSDLGRLDQLSLKAKVLQRADKLLDAAPGRYAHIQQVLRNAIDSRNHFVHGATVSARKGDFFRKMLPFHIDTLEYVFAVSDLLDAGWNYEVWSQRGTTMSHPLGEYRATYVDRVAEYIHAYNALIDSEY